MCEYLPGGLEHSRPKELFLCVDHLKLVAYNLCKGKSRSKSMQS